MFRRFVANGDLVFWIRFKVEYSESQLNSLIKTYFMLMLDHEETSENET